MQTTDFLQVRPANAVQLPLDQLKATTVSTGKSAMALPIGATIEIPNDAIEQVIAVPITINGIDTQSKQIPAIVNEEKKFISINRFVGHLFADETEEFDKLFEAEPAKYATMIKAGTAENLFDRVSALAGTKLRVSKRFTLPYTPYGKATPSKRVFTAYEDIADVQ